MKRFLTIMMVFVILVGMFLLVFENNSYADALSISEKPARNYSHTKDKVVAGLLVIAIVGGSVFVLTKSNTQNNAEPEGKVDDSTNNVENKNKGE